MHVFLPLFCFSATFRVHKKKVRSEWISTHLGFAIKHNILNRLFGVRRGRMDVAFPLVRN